MGSSKPSQRPFKIYRSWKDPYSSIGRLKWCMLALGFLCIGILSDTQRSTRMHPLSFYPRSAPISLIMVLERRRTIICKSSSDSPKTKTPQLCNETRPRSKRVHHSRPTLVRQNQHDFDRDEDIVQADLIEISLVGDPVPVRDDSDSISDSTELVEKLIESARGGNLITFQRLCTRMMQCHLRLDAPGYMGWTAAHWAAREGHVHLLEHLTMLHANLDAVDLKGDTLLHKAAANGQPAACVWLIERGFSAKLRNNNNLTPLDLAQEHIATSRRSNAALLCEKMLSTEYSEQTK